MSKNQDRGARIHPRKRQGTGRSGGRWLALVGSTCVCAAIIILAVMSKATLLWFSDAPSNIQMQSGEPRDVRIGTVELQTGQGQCDLLKFDNDTGRTIEGSKRCHSGVPLDANGLPVPMGTVHRLGSIRKSFLGDGR
jgi:hypothetical protein